MTEYAYDEDEQVEDDLDVHERLAELEERLEAQAEVDRVNEQIRDLERAHGSRFTPDEVQELGALLDQGYDPQSVYEHVAPSSPDAQAFERQFDTAVDRLEQRQGRTILQSEVDRLWEAANREGDPTHVEDGAVRDLGTRAGRIGHIDERIHPPEEQPAVIEPLSPDAGPKQRIAYANARVAGAEVATPDTEHVGDE